MSKAVLAVSLTVMWIALWGELSWANLLGGMVASAGLLTVFRLPTRRSPAYAIHPLAAVRFAAYFVWKLAEANAVIAYEVITPGYRTSEGIVAVPIRGLTDGLITLVANTITLTPGTVTLDVTRSPAVLYVHVLHLRDIEATRRDILHLEDLAIRAFGPPDTVAELDGGRRRPILRRNR